MFNLKLKSKLMVLLALVTVAPSPLSIIANTQQASASGQRPNIVVILTDDQTVADMQWMPKTASLIGGQGVTYSTSWTSLSWCCPSRATLQTGQHAQNHGVFSNSLPAGGYKRFAHQTALPVWLQNAGYRTIHIGKALNDTNMARPSGWDDWRATVRGDHKMYNWYLNDNGRQRFFGRGVDNYQGDVYAAMASDVIARSPANQPFFLYYSVSAPHVSVNRLPIPPKRYLNTVKDPLPRPPSFELPAGETIERLQLEYRRRAESLKGADDQVETIFNALRDKGVLDNTVVIFTSDNGYLMGEHGVRGKSNQYQEAMAVPLLIRGPGFARGVVENAPVQNIDIAPTIAELAQATPLVTVDGISLLQSLNRNRALFFESKRDDPLVPIWTGVRTERFVYTDRGINGQGAILWDMKNDPYQMNNVANDPRYTQVTQTLQDMMRSKVGCRGAACYFTSDNTLLDQLADNPAN